MFNKLKHIILQLTTCQFLSNTGNILKNRDTNRNVHQHAYTLKAGVLFDVKSMSFVLEQRA